MGLLVSRVKKTGFKYRSFNPGEDSRLSAVDAVRQVAVSSGIVIPLQDQTIVGSNVHNIRALFVAGLADGMSKPRLLLAGADYQAPLDIRDTTKTFMQLDDIPAFVADFCPAIVSHFTMAEPSIVDRSSLLASLKIGDPTAENEMTTLERYYLKTDQYQRALRGEVNLVVGRKGSGKTALFIQVRDKIRADKRNIVVDLKPEGYQLIKLKEEILAYLSAGARQHLITAFWEYLILLEVAYKLLEKDQHTYKFNHEIHDLYLELTRAYRVDDFSVEGDFSERLLALSNKIARKYQAQYGQSESQRLTAEQVTGLLYSHDIRALLNQISGYLEKKGGVWILFDNLDKGWSTHGVDVIDAIVLRCLVDAGRKVEREMRKRGHQFHCVVFVRNDVYDHLMKSSADYGKEMRATLDWTDPDLLREMLRLRLVSGLDSKVEGARFTALWPDVCVYHYRGEESSNYFIERSLMRPRNLLKIFNHCRGFATNFNHTKIEESDIEKGLRAYSQDLLSELDRELNDVFPEAEDLLYYFLDAPTSMSQEELTKLIKAAGTDKNKIEKVIDFLLYYGVIGVHSGGV
ncbi:P-loop ATPase, Sll1717 family, partial [Nitrospira sp. BLG_2]|uniref:P-loop ATPase, Sll1717 family n=1 Tax=Nitrospira sp. BLG_2 TaxID=3397507 RepID=UPI003B9D29A5